MKKNILSSFALMMAISVGANAQALRENGFSVTFKGGVAPIIMSGSEEKAVANLGSSVSVFAKTPTFSKTQDLPWIGAAELEYAFGTNIGGFIEGAFTYSKGKESTLTGATVGANTASLKVKPDAYKDIAGYAGVRAYFDVGSGFSPFIQGKIGVLHQMKSDATFKGTINNAAASVKVPYYKSGTTLSAGAGLGAVLNFDNSFSLVLTGEGVYKGDRTTLGKKESMWAFPATAGLRITF